MTEQEIVNYLKGNLNKGVAFGFMPREVQHYITSNFKNLLFLDGENQWIKTLERQECWKNMIFALPQDFKFEEKSKAKWVEFEIDNDGFFMSDKGAKTKWYCWSGFLLDSRHRNYTAFGGWKYENDNRWYMAPAIKLNTDNYYWNSYTAEKEEVKPAVPVKIRFWRETNK